MTARTVRREISENEYQPAAYIAELLHRSAQTIYGWGRRGEIRKEVRKGTTLYSLSDCRARAQQERIAAGVVAPKPAIDDGKYLTMESRDVSEFRTKMKDNLPVVEDLVSEIVTEIKSRKSAKVADKEAREEAVKMSQAKIAAAPDPTPIRLTAQMAPTDALGEVDRKLAEKKKAIQISIGDHEEAIAALKVQLGAVEEKEVMALEAREAFNKLAALLSEV